MQKVNKVTGQNRITPTQPRQARRSRPQTRQFRPELLPPARSFYEREFGSALGRERRGWAQTKCCFHDGNSKTSLSLNMADRGGFKCFSCGVHGGDLIAFVRLRYRLDFRGACRELGCWDETGRFPKKPRRIVVGRDLVMQYMIESTEYTTRVPDDSRNELDLLRRVKAEACDRLTEIGRGDRERFEREGELQWQVAADSHQLIRNEELANGS